MLVGFCVQNRWLTDELLDSTVLSITTKLNQKREQRRKDYGGSEHRVVFLFAFDKLVDLGPAHKEKDKRNKNDWYVHYIDFVPLLRQNQFKVNKISEFEE